jgi:ABC-2 type transport system ATP-binding protein
MLERGRIIADETPAGLIHRYGRGNLEEVFIDIARHRSPVTLAPREAAQ